MKQFICALATMAAAQENEDAVDPTTLANKCFECIFEGFHYCEPLTNSSAPKACIAADQSCGNGLVKWSSFAQCSASYQTTSVASNCGKTHTMTDTQLTPLEVEDFRYDVNRSELTIAANTGCIVKVNTNFASETQVGGLGIWPPHADLEYMMTTQDWTIANTALTVPELQQLDQTSSGQIPIKKGEFVNLLVMNNGDSEQTVNLTF